MKTFFLSLLTFCIFCASGFSESLPAKPDKYFNDYAGLVSSSQASVLNEKLAYVDKKSSNQIVVAIYPSIDSDRPTEDIANDLFKAWKIGDAKKNNGILVLLIKKDSTGHTSARIEVGYGLEGAIPDITALEILNTEGIPLFKQNKYFEGFDSVVTRLSTLAQSEYKATQTTGAKEEGKGKQVIGVLMIIIIFYIILCFIFGPATATEFLFNVVIQALLSCIGSSSNSSGSSSSSFGGSGGSSGGGGASSKYD